MSTTTAEPTTTTPCPSWCTTDHTDMGAGFHQGPTFGPFLTGEAVELAATPGLLNYEVAVDASGEFVTVSELLDLARNALDAAAWLEAHR